MTHRTCKCEYALTGAYWCLLVQAATRCNTQARPSKHDIQTHPPLPLLLLLPLLSLLPLCLFFLIFLSISSLPLSLCPLSHSSVAGVSLKLMVSHLVSYIIMVSLTSSVAGGSGVAGGAMAVTASAPPEKGPSPTSLIPATRKQ